jgi:hypothetical protein
LVVAESEPYDINNKSDLDHIKLLRHDDVLAKSLHDTSLWSIILDSPLSLSHARNKIAELKCLKSVYAPEFTFNLIGEYGVDNNFLVHRICITCDEISNSQHNKRIHESF